MWLAKPVCDHVRHFSFLWAPLTLCAMATLSTPAANTELIVLTVYNATVRSARGAQQSLN